MFLENAQIINGTSSEQEKHLRLTWLCKNACYLPFHL